MRVRLSAALVLLASAAPALHAQRGGQPYVQPEIRPQQPVGPAAGVPASNAVADLTERLDALEGQIARMTGAAEENAHRIRQLEQSVRRLEAEAADRAAAPPAPRAEPEPSTAEEEEGAGQGGDPAPAPAAEGDRGSTGDPAEDAYLAGYRLWEQGRFADAAEALEAMARKHPRHRRASFARNLAGRAQLDDGDAAAAARTLLANYQEDPKGDRAADSLYFLGAALMRLQKPAEACRVYDELQDVYGATLRDFLKQSLPKARAEAKCG